MDSFKLPTHQISYREGNPYSELFQDIFHSKDGSSNEAKHVFINGNNLEERINLIESPKFFSICELGFGFGVSLLTTWESLSKYNDLYIDYVSIEGFPITKEELEKYLTNLDFSENLVTKKLMSELVDNYPPLIKGTHRILLSEGRLCLTLIFDDVSSALKKINSKFDAWYLDGFSPRKNSEMWDKEIFKEMVTLSKSGATFSTYSSSNSIVKSAEEAGFKTKKISGYGSKKEMTIGEINNDQVNHYHIKRNSNLSIAIIGSGLSGISTAYSLCQRGLNVTIFEKEDDFSTKASGNKRAVIMPQLSSVPDAQCQYYLSGYLHSIRTILNINKQIKLNSFSKNGATRYCNVKKWKSVWDKLEILGLDHIIKKIWDPISLFFVDGGSIMPKELLSAILELYKDNINLKLNSEVINIEEIDNKISLTSNNKKYYFDYLIFSGAYESAYQEDLKWIPIEKIKGEICDISLDNFSTDIPLCYDGYLIPVEKNKYLIGATYEHNSHSEETNPEVYKELLTRLNKTLGREDLNSEYLGGKVCFRTTSPDRLPVIGRIKSDSNIFVSIGHGSRGMVSTFLASEIIASEICNQTAPLPNNLLKEIIPSRFKDRERKRNLTLEEIYPASFLWRH